MPLLIFAIVLNPETKETSYIGSMTTEMASDLLRLALIEEAKKEEAKRAVDKAEEVITASKKEVKE